MTTRILIANFGPGNVEVSTGNRPIQKLYPGGSLTELFVYPGQDIVVKEQVDEIQKNDNSTTS